MAELMAVHHRRGQTPELQKELRTCMIAIAPPLVQNERDIELYEQGSKNLL